MKLEDVYEYEPIERTDCGMCMSGRMEGVDGWTKLQGCLALITDGCVYLISGGQDVTSI